MKQFTCEMCGSTDLVKQDGVFVCQTCGTKYSIEEAKKMMVEGTVQIIGTVKIDDSDSYDKFIDLARDAFNDSRYENAYDYSSKALNIHADSPEIILLLGLSLLGKEEFGRAIPTGCTNAVEAYMEKVSSFEWEPETVKEFTIAKDYIASVCRYKIAMLQSNIDEIKVELKPTRDALDVFADLGRPVFVVSQNQAEDKRIELHNKQVQAKIEFVQQKINVIKKFQEQSIHRIDVLSNEKKEATAKKRRNEYWVEHEKERHQLEVERQKLCAKKDSIAEQIGTLVTDKNSVPTLLKKREIDQMITNLRLAKEALGPFKWKEKKELQVKIESLEEDAKTLTATIAKEQQPINQQLEDCQKKSDEITQRLAEIQAEFDKDR